MAQLLLSFPAEKILSFGLSSDTIGFTVGADADYQFRLVEYAEDLDAAESFTAWDYDAFGRKIAESVYTDTSATRTVYLYDGWRPYEEVAVDLDDDSTRVAAVYVPGPGYIDDVVATVRDQDGDGFESDELFYHLTDQQHSTVALLDATGNYILERYSYDEFGAPSFYDGDGTPRADSLLHNPRLYTGQRYLPDLNVYDYRQRLYDPAQGRFTARDPIGAFGDMATRAYAAAHLDL